VASRIESGSLVRTAVVELKRDARARNKVTFEPQKNSSGVPRATSLYGKR